MKRSIKLLAVIALLVGLMASSVMAENMSYLGRSDWGEWYYSLGGMVTSRNGVACSQIFCQITLTDAGRQGFGMNASFARILYYIDCAGNRFASIGISFFDAGRNRIGEPQVNNEFDWQDIQPGTMADTMRKKCCGLPI